MRQPAYLAVKESWQCCQKNRVRQRLKNKIKCYYFKPFPKRVWFDMGKKQRLRYNRGINNCTECLNQQLETAVALNKEYFIVTFSYWP